MMADQIDVKLEGIEKAIAALKKYQLVKIQGTKDVLKEVAFKIEAAAKQIMSEKGVWDTGRGASSMSTNWSGSGMAEGKTGSKAQSGDGMPEPQGAAGLVICVGSNVFYLPYHEHGTSRIDARPFLFPAYFMHVNEAHKRLSELYKKAI